MNKYLYMIIFGILIYLLLNRYNCFSVGIPQYIITVSPDGSDIDIRPSKYSENQGTWEVNDDGVVLSSTNKVIRGDSSIYYVYGMDEDTARINFEEYMSILQSTAGAGGGGAGGPAGNVRAIGNVRAMCSVELNKSTYMIFARKISKFILRPYNKYKDDPEFSHDSRGEKPLQKAVSYTLQNDNIPLFYNASRFYYTIANKVKNNSIDDLTINEPSDSATISSSTSLFNWSFGDSSIYTSVFSVSTCLSDLTVEESATDLYLNPEHNTRSEWNEYNLQQIQDFIKSHIPESTTGADRTRIEEIIDGIDISDLLTRVLIVLKPISTDDSDIDALLENNVRVTLRYGVNRRETTREEIIDFNQKITRFERINVQGRLLYRNTDWNAKVFLSTDQEGIINRFT